MKQVKNNINHTLDIKRSRGFSLLRNIEKGLMVDTNKESNVEVLEVLEV
jgi:hypothetical protein